MKAKLERISNALYLTLTAENKLDKLFLGETFDSLRLGKAKLVPVRTAFRLSLTLQLKEEQEDKGVTVRHGDRSHADSVEVSSPA